MVATTRKAPETQQRRKRSSGLPALSVGGRTEEQGASPSSGTPSSEYVWAMLKLNGVELPANPPSSVVALYKTLKKHSKIDYSSKPVPGDVVFFHNTEDQNSDGRNNDWYTAVGVVTAVDADNTATVSIYRQNRVNAIHLNLERPDVSTDGDRTLNSALRQPGTNDAPHTQYYSGQLFAGFSRTMDDRHDMVMVANWKPGMSLTKP